MMAAQSGLLQLEEQYSSSQATQATESFSSPGKDSVTGLRDALFLMDGTSANSFDLLNLSEEETEQELSKSVGTKASGTVKSTAAHSASNVHHPQEEQFMVEIICKKFLQLFLVGVGLIV